MIYSLRFGLKHEHSKHRRDRCRCPVLFVLPPPAPSSPFCRYKQTQCLMSIIRQGWKDLISRCAGRNAACHVLVIFDRVFAPAVSEGAISIALALPRTGLSWRTLPRSPELEAGQGAELFRAPSVLSQAARPGVTPTCRNPGPISSWAPGTDGSARSAGPVPCHPPIRTLPAPFVKPGSFKL